MEYLISSAIVRESDEEIISEFDPSQDDSIALRYGRSPINIQGFCNGCSQPFDISHALDCKMGD